MANDSQESSRRAIVGDRNHVDTSLLRLLLEPFFGSVACERSALAVVAAVTNSVDEDSPYHVVFVNRHMEGLDGIAATQLIRENGYQGVIVGTSGEMTQKLRDEWTAAGATTFMTKPVLLDALADVVLNQVMRWDQH